MLWCESVVVVYGWLTSASSGSFTAQIGWNKTATIEREENTKRSSLSKTLIIYRIRGKKMCYEVWMVKTGGEWSPRYL